MANDVLQQVRLRNKFYKDSYRTLLAVFILSLLVNAGLAGLSFYQWTHRPSTRYVVTTADGRILPRYPLTAAIMSEQELLQWAKDAIVASYRYDYVNWQTQLEQVQQYYTASGFDGFKKKLNSTQQLRYVQDNKIIVDPTPPTGAPTIIKKGVLNNRFVWEIQMPLMVQYKSATRPTTSTFLDVTIRVQRDDVLSYPKGVAISSFVAMTGQNALGTVRGG